MTKSEKILTVVFVACALALLLLVAPGVMQ